MSVTAGVRDKLSGKISLTRVTRHQSGVFPKWAHDLDNDDHLDLPRCTSAPDSGFLGSKGTTRDDRGLVGSSREDVCADHHRVRQQAEVVFATEEESKLREAEDASVMEEEEEVQEERRHRIRERQLLRECEEDEELVLDSHLEYETDLDEDEGVWIAVVKPVFVPKPRRDTIADREGIKEERQQLEELVKRRLEEQKFETRRFLVEVIMKDEHIEKAHEEEAADVVVVDTDDEANKAEEYEAWKNREIARVKRDREERDMRLKEEEIELVWNMTEEERREWERRNPKPVAQPKRKWKFMQKYYHKGAFFQEKVDDGSLASGLDDIYQRDFSEATGEDKMDRRLPFQQSIMQK